MKLKIEQSCLFVDKPIKIITHGFNDRAASEWVRRMRDAYLKREDINVITVDWHHGATLPYEQAVANSFLVARQVGRLIRHLELVHGVPPLTVHLIGHSLGAQISGNAGHATAPSRVARISGLDPAGPLFDDFNDTQRLDSGDAVFVDVIHTDGEVFTGLKGYGSLRPQGRVDFYPNGGVKQPGCCTLPDTSYDRLAEFGSENSGLGCSHSRAIYLFIQSLEAGTSSAGSNSSMGHQCVIYGHQECQSLKEFEAGNCTDCPGPGCIPLGVGADVFTKSSAKIYLSTSWEYPYCGHDYQMTVYVAGDRSHAYGRLFLVWESATSANISSVDFSRSDQQYRSKDVKSHIITTGAGLDSSSSLELVFVKGSGLSSLGTDSGVAIDRIDIQDLSDVTNRWSLCGKPETAVRVDEKGSKYNFTRCNV